jgi:transcriptional regulator with XRE-family HTH domain
MPVARLTFFAIATDRLRSPARTKWRWESEQPTSRAVCACPFSSTYFESALRPSMPADFATGKVAQSRKTLLVENGPLLLAAGQSRRMAKARKDLPPLYLGPWFARLGRKPSEIARKVGIEESYLSLLISGDKKNPSAAIVYAISEELGISMNDLYRHPPERDVTNAIVKLRPDQLSALSDLLDEIGGPRRNKIGPKS